MLLGRVLVFWLPLFSKSWNFSLSLFFAVADTELSTETGACDSVSYSTQCNFVTLHQCLNLLNPIGLISFLMADLHLMSQSSYLRLVGRFSCLAIIAAKSQILDFRIVHNSAESP